MKGRAKSHPSIVTRLGLEPVDCDNGWRLEDIDQGFRQGVKWVKTANQKLFFE